jgi:RNA polymerase sigma-70 factor (ECF subfamily)
MAHSADPKAPSRPLRLVTTERTDEALVLAFNGGETDAFGELVQRYDRLVFSLMRRYANSPEEARDLAQRAFVRSFEAAPRTLPRLAHNTEFPFRAWLVRVAVNVAKNHVRDARRWARAPLSGVEEGPSPVPDAQAQLETEELRRRTRQAVLQLPKRQREVFTLRIDGELPFAEIATAIGITENNAKVHFHHAVQRLKRMVAENGDPT